MGDGRIMKSQKKNPLKISEKMDKLVLSAHSISDAHFMQAWNHMMKAFQENDPLKGNEVIASLIILAAHFTTMTILKTKDLAKDLANINVSGKVMLKDIESSVKMMLDKVKKEMTAKKKRNKKLN